MLTLLTLRNQNFSGCFDGVHCGKNIHENIKQHIITKQKPSRQQINIQIIGNIAQMNVSAH